MRACAACGHQLGVGRFCNNCGHPADGTAGQVPKTPEAGAPAAVPEEWRTDTAERERASVPPAVVPPPEPRVPPAAVTPPPPPRYPLYADEVGVDSTGPAVPATGAATATATATATASVEPAPKIEEPEPREEWEPDQDERRSVLTWVAALLLLALVAVGGWVAWEYSNDDPGTKPGTPQATDEPPTSTGQPEGVDVASQAIARAPETAPPGEDVDGQLVSFDASNMLDGVPQTAWRAPGDASGMELTFRLGERTTLTSVGMINGYDKKSKDAEGRTFDWYRGNRRIETVVWDFGDGSTVRQKFEEDRAMQSIEIDPVITKKVIVRLVKVSPPGDGRASRDFTAISEVSLVGMPT